MSKIDVYLSCQLAAAQKDLLSLYQLVEVIYAHLERDGRIDEAERCAFAHALKATNALENWASIINTKKLNPAKDKEQ